MWVGGRVRRSLITETLSSPEGGSRRPSELVGLLPNATWVFNGDTTRASSLCLTVESMISGIDGVLSLSLGFLGFSGVEFGSFPVFGVWGVWEGMRVLGGFFLCACRLSLCRSA